MIDLIANHVLKRIMIWLAVILCSVAFGYFWHYQSVAYSACMDIPYVTGWVAEPRTVAAMEYHGVRFAENMEGTLVFWRDNQWCKLINSQFLKVWNR